MIREWHLLTLLSGCHFQASDLGYTLQLIGICSHCLFDIIRHCHLRYVIKLKICDKKVTPVNLTFECHSQASDLGYTLQHFSLCSQCLLDIIRHCHFRYVIKLKICDKRVTPINPYSCYLRGCHFQASDVGYTLEHSDNSVKVKQTCCCHFSTKRSSYFNPRLYTKPFFC